MTMSKDFDIHEWRLYQANLNLLNEEEEDDFNITTDSFDVVELGIGDIITPDMWDRSSENNFFLDEPVKITDWEEEDGQTYFYVKNQSVDNIFAVDLHQYLKPKYQVVLPLDESDDDFNITTNSFDELELTKGDSITPEMWDLTNPDLDFLIDDPDEDWMIKRFNRFGDVELRTETGGYIVSGIDTVNDLLKSTYKIVKESLNESDDEDDFNIEVGDKWNVKTITTGNTFKIGNSIYRLGEFSEGGKRVDVFKDDLSKPLNTTVKLIQSKLGDEYEITPPLTEQEDDFDIEVSDKWNEIELSIGDTITHEMWKDPYKTGGLPRSNWKIVAIDSEWDDIELENENKGNGTQGYITWSISSIQNLLKPEYKIVEDKELLEQEDDEWDIEVGSNWNEFEGEFVLTYKVVGEGYVYVQDDIKEFQRLNPGIDEFNYEEEPIRINTTYKSRPVNMKYFISNYEDNTGHTLLPYTEEPTTEGFKKWLKDNNWNNEEFIFLYDIFSPSVIKEEYYDYRENLVKITNKMKERRGWLDDVSGVEVIDVKFLG
jgi:hypothetical protein